MLLKTPYMEGEVDLLLVSHAPGSADGPSAEAERAALDAAVAERARIEFHCQVDRIEPVGREADAAADAREVRGLAGQPHEADAGVDLALRAIKLVAIGRGSGGRGKESAAAGRFCGGRCAASGRQSG